MSQQTLPDALGHRSIVRAGRGEKIYEQDQAARHCFVVTTGWVALYARRRGREPVMCEALGVGELFGEDVFGPYGIRLMTATARSRVELRVFDNTAFGDDRLGDVRDSLVSLLAQRSFRVARLVAEAREPASTRVLLRLADVVAAAMAPGSDHGHIDILQDELAELAGVTRQTANGELARFRDAGLISIRYGRIVVPDRDRLVAEVNRILAVD